jgi:hypothetical protein
MTLARWDLPAHQRKLSSQHESYNLWVLPDDQNLEPDTGGSCQLRGRRVGERWLTRHHLLPRAVSRRMRRRKLARRELKRRDPARTIALCRPCHRNLHASVSSGDLGQGYDSLEALSAHPDVEKFTEWVRDKPHGRS